MLNTYSKVLHFSRKSKPDKKIKGNVNKASCSKKVEKHTEVNVIEWASTSKYDVVTNYGKCFLWSALG